MDNQYEARYETKLVELKYIEPIKSGGTWNIFEKHRGKMVINLPNQLGVGENPPLMLVSDHDQEVAKLNEDLAAAKEALKLANLKIGSEVAHPQSVWFEIHILEKQRKVLEQLDKGGV